MKYLHPLNLQESRKTSPLSASRAWKRASVMGIRFDTQREDIEDFFAGLKDLGKSEVSISYTFFSQDLEKYYERSFENDDDAITNFFNKGIFYKEDFPGIRILVCFLDPLDLYLLSEQFQELEVSLDRLSENHKIKILTERDEGSYFYKTATIGELNRMGRHSIKYEIRVLDSSFKKNK